MNDKLYIKVFGDLAAYQEMLPDQYYKSLNSEFEKMLDTVEMHCLYVIQDLPEGCQANCSFCTQGRDSNNQNRKSTLINRYLVKYPVKKLVQMIKEGFLEKRDFRRICYSAVYHQNTNDNLIKIFKMIRSVTNIPLTACCVPDSKERLIAIKEAGADRVVINFEIATEKLFEKIRGINRENSPYSWAMVYKNICDALDVFGPHKVGTHLLIGIGETHQDALSFIDTLYEKKINVSLFAFQPVPGTDLENHPKISYKDYHKVQLGRFLMLQKKTKFEDFKFNSSGEIIDYGVDKNSLIEIINTGKPFRNMGGCPYCNRVFYDSDYTDRIYNYPRDLYQNEIDLIRKELLSV